MGSTKSVIHEKFQPVELGTTEQQTLQAKIDVFTDDGNSSSIDASTETSNSTPSDTEEAARIDSSETTKDESLNPELYLEGGSKRRIELTERELNSLRAQYTDLAEQLIVDLSGDLASIKLLIDLDPDLPFIGGKTLKVTGGTELSFQNERPVVVMTGVSVWGVPMPNAWLGGLKNIDLVQEFGGEGFWKGLGEGIEDIRVEDGKLMIQLAE